MLQQELTFWRKSGTICGVEAALEAGMDLHRESQVSQGHFWDMDMLRGSCSHGASHGTEKKKKKFAFEVTSP